MISLVWSLDRFGIFNEIYSLAGFHDFARRNPTASRVEKTKKYTHKKQKFRAGKGSRGPGAWRLAKIVRRRGSGMEDGE